MLSSEEATVVGEIAVAGSNGHFHGVAVVVVVAVVVASHPPCIPCGKAFQLSHGVEDGSTQFAPEPWPPPLGIIEENTADAVGDFTDTDTAHRGSNKVVDGWRLTFAEELPLQRT